MSKGIDSVSDPRSCDPNLPRLDSFGKPPQRNANETASNNQHPQEGPFDQVMDWLGDCNSNVKNELVERLSNTYDNINTTITETLGIGSAQDLIDDQLKQLNSDGDIAVFQLRPEGKAAIVAVSKGSTGIASR